MNSLNLRNRFDRIYDWQVFNSLAEINQLKMMGLHIINWSKKVSSRDRQEVIDKRLRYNQHRQIQIISKMRKLTNSSLKYTDIFSTVEIELVGWTYVIPYIARRYSRQLIHLRHTLGGIWQAFNHSRGWGHCICEVGREVPWYRPPPPFQPAVEFNHLFFCFLFLNCRI